MSFTLARASNISWQLLLVDCSPWRTLTMCPLAVAVESGRYFRSFLLKPGNDCSSFGWFCSARNIADFGGDPMHW